MKYHYFKACVTGRLNEYALFRYPSRGEPIEVMVGRPAGHRLRNVETVHWSVNATASSPAIFTKGDADELVKYYNETQPNFVGQ